MHNVDVISFEKILKNVGVTKASKIDQISAKFPKEDALVIAILLPNITKLSIKLDTIPSQCIIAKTKSLFKKRIKTELKVIGVFLCCI